MTEAAYTGATPTPENGDGAYPAYINARVENDKVVVRVRTEGAIMSSQISMEPGDFVQWHAELYQIAQEAASLQGG